jgi:hypothetical protein
MTIAATSRASYDWREEGIVTFGLDFPEAAASQLKRLGKKKVFLIASGGLSRNTPLVQNLEEQLSDVLVGKKVGIQPHSLWSEILEIAEAARIRE